MTNCVDLCPYSNDEMVCNGECQTIKLIKFKRGDLVIITAKVWGQEPWGDLCYIFSIAPNSYHIVGCDRDISVGFDNTDSFRHATPEEIIAKRRLIETLTDEQLERGKGSSLTTQGDE